MICLGWAHYTIAGPNRPHPLLGMAMVAAVAEPPKTGKSGGGNCSGMVTIQAWRQRLALAGCENLTIVAGMPSRDEILSIYQAGPDAVVAWVGQLLASQADLRAQLLANQANQAKLEQQVQVLTARLTELEVRLNKDSHNSHQPPSSDGPAKRPHPRSLRRRSGKKRGGRTVIPVSPAACWLIRTLSSSICRRSAPAVAPAWKRPRRLARNGVR